MLEETQNKGRKTSIRMTIMYTNTFALLNNFLTVIYSGFAHNVIRRLGDKYLPSLVMMRNFKFKDDSRFQTNQTTM